MRHAIAAALMLPIAFSGCAQLEMTVADPAVVAKINYVCAYSGLFKFADSAALSVIPVAGPAVAGAINSAVSEACLHPEAVARGEAAVIALIDKFRAMGKM